MLPDEARSAMKARDVVHVTDPNGTIKGFIINEHRTPGGPVFLVEGRGGDGCFRSVWATAPEILREIAADPEGLGFKPGDPVWALDHDPGTGRVFFVESAAVVVQPMGRAGIGQQCRVRFVDAAGEPQGVPVERFVVYREPARAPEEG